MKFYSVFVIVCLIQLCLSAPLAEAEDEEPNFEKLTIPELLIYIQVWADELKDPKSTQEDRSDFKLGIIDASVKVATRIAGVNLDLNSIFGEETKVSEKSAPPPEDEKKKFVEVG